MDEGWLFKVKVENEDEVKELMSEEDYKDYLKSQEEEDK